MSDEEEFDHGAMAIGNLDNASPPAEKIAVGSLQGMLRIYFPSRPGFRIEDLILEESLGAPIIQLLVGRFIPSTDINGLAVLHPRSLVVYEVLPQGNKDGRVNYYSLRRAYAHDLGIEGRHFTAYNMASGRFGGSKDRDMFVVQSMDGKLQILEQSANAFTRQLADCLIPGPIAYVPKVDAFVTVNHAAQAECYRYQVLASSQSDIGAKDAKGGAGGGHDGVGSFGLRSIRSAMVEWSLNLGEPCKQILEGCFSLSDSDMASITSSGIGGGMGLSRPSELLMLCDKSVYLLKGDTGGIIQQRRLERSEASCMCVVPNAHLGRREDIAAGGRNFILAGQDNTIQVFSSFNLTWAAKLNCTPVQMGVTRFGHQDGLIACIDDAGYLSINYLGTRPPVTTVLTQVRELNYDKVEEEHRALLQIIRDSQNEDRVQAPDKLYIRPQYPKSIDTEPIADSELPVSDLAPLYSSNLGGGSDGSFVKVLVRLYLSYSGDRPARNVSITIDAPKFVHVSPHRQIVLPKVAGLKSTPIMVRVYFYALKSHIASGLEALVTASYLSFNGEPRVTSLPLQLPLCLACRPKPPVKSASCKVILDTGEMSAFPLTELFGDYLYAYQQSGVDVGEVVGSNAVQAMGFQLFCAPTAPNNLSGMVSAAVSGGSSSTGENSNNNNKFNGIARSTSGDGVSSKTTLIQVAATGAKSQSSVVSVLVSKNAGRYRVQAESYPALYLIMDELDKRLNARGNAEGKNGNSTTTPAADPAAPAAVTPGSAAPVPSIVKITDPLPLDQYFQIIEAHFKVRKTIVELTSQLNDYSHQFRMVEKRLLVRYKDRNPTPLAGLDLLMNESYKKILSLSDTIEVNQNLLRRMMVELEGFSRVLALMTALKYGLTYAERDLLGSYLCPQITEGSDQGWEETVNAAVTYLLKTSLARNVKESASLSGTSLEMPSSIEPLKKHLLLLFDRLDKGGRLTSALTHATPGTGPGHHNSHSRRASGGNNGTGSGTGSHGSAQSKNSPLGPAAGSK